MYFSDFKKIVDQNTEYPANARAIVDAADMYYISRYGQQADVIGSLPTVDEAGIAAVKISEMVKPELTTHEQSFFITGFQECIKWLSNNDH